MCLDMINPGAKMMKRLLSLATLAVMAGTSFAGAADIAKYSVTFNANWTEQSHMIDYPKDAHLSGLIGTTHNKDYSIFADGKIATAGFKVLAETGKHTPLDREITKAIDKGTAGVKFESGPLFKFPGKISARFIASSYHPYASVAAMIAPSPDWFVGASKVSLRPDGKWVDTITVPLLAWDAGTDIGVTYKSPNAEAKPRQSIRVSSAAQFIGQNGVRTLGTLTFTRVNNATN
jgi:Spondin_N